MNQKIDHAQFAATIKQKYPQYANVDDAALATAMLQKYPQYKQMVNEPKSVGGFVKNIGTSAVDAVKGIGSSLINVVNPDMEKNTVANLGRLGVGVAQLLDPTQVLGTGQEETARNVGRFYDQRYGFSDALKGDFAEVGRKWGDTAYYDPVGTALDVSAVIGGAGALAKGAGSAAKVSGLTKAGQGLTAASEAINPISQAGRLSSGIFSKAVRGSGAALEGVADDIVLKGAGKPTKKLQEALERAKTTAPEFIEKYDLYSRDPSVAQAAGRSILDKFDDKTITNPSAINPMEVVQAFDDEIARIKGSPQKFSNAGKAQMRELQVRRNQIVKSMGGKLGKGGKKVSYLPEATDTKALTEFRRGALDPDIPQSMFGLDPRGSGTAMGTKASRNIVRKLINATDEELSQLGLDYGVAKEMQNYFKQGADRAKGRQMFNFTKLGSAGLGGVVAGFPGAVAGYVGEQVVNSPEFIKAASKTTKFAGRALQSAKLGEVGNKVAAPFSKAVNAGITASRLTPPAPEQPKTAGMPKMPTTVATPPAPVTTAPTKTNAPAQTTSKQQAAAAMKASQKLIQKPTYSSKNYSLGAVNFSKPGSVKRGSFY